MEQRVIAIAPRKRLLKEKKKAMDTDFLTTRVSNIRENNIFKVDSIKIDSLRKLSDK